VLLAMTRRLAFALVPALALAACDGAKPDYERCVALKVGHAWAAAERACSAAVEADPRSRYGKKAAVKLAAIKKARAQAAQHAAEARSERERLLDTEPADRSPWLPASEQQLESWRQLRHKYPKSAEAAEATRRLARETSLCRRYVAETPYDFRAHVTIFTTISNGIHEAFSAWSYKQGSEQLLPLLRAAQAAIASERSEVRAICAGIVEHPEQPGEADIKLSLARDCMKLNAQAQRMHEAFDLADGVEAFAVQYMVTWPDLEERNGALSRALKASEARRTARCQELHASGPDAEACPDQGECAGDSSAHKAVAAEETPAPLQPMAARTQE
jgi:hypothetical protein